MSAFALRVAAQSAVGLLSIAALSILPAGCCDKLNDPKLSSVAADLDRMSASVQEFGTASMSAPVFTSPDSTFAFDLGSNTASTYYNDAKTSVQARIGDFAQTSNIIGLAGNVSVDPTMAAAYLGQLAQYQSAVAQNTQAQQLANQKQSMQNGLALQGLNLQLAQAAKETDPAQQLQDMTAAQNNFAAQFQAPGPTTLPAFPTASYPTTAPSDLAKSASDAAAAFASNQFSGFQGLLNGKSAPTVSDLQAINIAAAANSTAAIFKALGDPTLASKFADKKVLMGVVTVAVNPGWRTRQHYASDLAMRVKYKYENARLDVVKNFINDNKYDLSLRKRVAMSYSLTLPTGTAQPFPIGQAIPAEYQPIDTIQRSPLVSAVSPMSQSQVEEDLNSRRNQVQIALDLAGAYQMAGLTAQANFFDHYAQSLQQDVDSVNATVAVNTYSFNGGLFGFEVGPTLRAITHPSSIQSAPGDTLERQSFPALIIFGFDDDDLRPRIVVDSGGRFEVQELQLYMHQSIGWLPLTPDPLGGTLGALRGPLFGNKPFSEEERLVRLQNLAEDAKAANIPLTDEAVANAAVGYFGEFDSLISQVQTALAAQPAKPSLSVEDDAADQLLTSARKLSDTDIGVDIQKNVADVINSLKQVGGTAAEQPQVQPTAAQLDRLDQLVAQKVDCAREHYEAKRARHQDPNAERPVSDSELADAKSQFTTVNKTYQKLHSEIAANRFALSGLSTIRAYRDEALGKAQEILPLQASQSELQDKINAAQKKLAHLPAKPPSNASQPANSTKSDAAKPNDGATGDPATTLNNQIQSLTAQRKTLTEQIVSDAVRIVELQQAMNSLGQDIEQSHGLNFAPANSQESLQSTVASLQGVLEAAHCNQPNSTVQDSYLDDLIRIRAVDLEYKDFGSTYEAPLPVTMIDAAAAVKHPAVSSVGNDFLPTPAHEWPAAGEVVDVQLIGSDLDSIDPKGISPLTLKSSISNPVQISGTPTVAAGVISVSVTIAPGYTLPFAFQLKLKTGTDSILTPPVVVGHEKFDQHVVIQQVTGPLTDPTKQSVDRQDYTNPPDGVVKSKVEQSKPTFDGKVDVNINHHP